MDSISEVSESYSIGRSGAAYINSVNINFISASIIDQDKYGVNWDVVTSIDDIKLIIK